MNVRLTKEECTKELLNAFGRVLMDKYGVYLNEQQLFTWSETIDEDGSEGIELNIYPKPKDEAGSDYQSI